MITIKKGNIFTSQCKTIVNTVNCVGVMGAGIAFEFKLRYPAMFDKYASLCERRLLKIGQLWLYQAEEGHYQFDNVLSFPTKNNWKDPSTLQYLELGLKKFIDTYKEKGITSIAFPILGAGKGGIEAEVSLLLMKSYLNQCDIDIEIWQYDPAAKDDLYDQIKMRFSKLTDEQVKQQIGIRSDVLKKVRIAFENENINSIASLSQQKGIGQVTLTKLFEFCTKPKPAEQEPLLKQPSLL